MVYTLKKAKRIINNMSGGAFKGAYGDNKPVFYEVQQGGATAEESNNGLFRKITNLRGINQEELTDPSKNAVSSALGDLQNSVSNLEQAQETALSKVNEYVKTEKQACHAEEEIVKKAKEVEKQKCSNLKSLKNARQKLLSSQEEEATATKSTAKTTETKSETKSEDNTQQNVLSDQTKQSLKKLMDSMNTKQETPKVTPKTNKLPFKILYVDKDLGTAMNKFANNAGTETFKGGSKKNNGLYFFDAKNEKIYDMNTKTKGGKQFIRKFLNKNKLAVETQNGGNLLTKDGKMYISKTTGGADLSNNLGVIYQTQGGSAKKIKSKKSKKSKNSKKKCSKKCSKKKCKK